MVTKIIGIKKFRENVTSLWHDAAHKNVRYVVMRHNKPLFEANPINEEELLIATFAKDIKTARAQAKAGKVYSHDEARKKLGL